MDDNKLGLPGLPGDAFGSPPATDICNPNDTAAADMRQTRACDCGPGAARHDAQIATNTTDPSGNSETQGLGTIAVRK